jgi:hypothetical protein
MYTRLHSPARQTLDNQATGCHLLHALAYVAQGTILLLEAKDLTKGIVLFHNGEQKMGVFLEG